MKTVYKNYGDVYAEFLQKHYPNLYLGGIRLNGGDWDAALRILGFTPERMVTNVLAERVVTKIQRRSALSGIRPKTLRWTVLRSSTIFGSWPNALIAAGLEVPDSPHDGRRGVLPVLRDALEQHSANDLPEKLKLHAMYYLGSLRNAKAALKTKRRFRAGWSTTKIIAAIRERRRLGNRSAIQQPDVITLLVSAAEAYLESWGNALHAAGIDPNLYLRRKCRKRTTLAKRDRLRL